MDLLLVLVVLALIVLRRQRAAARGAARRGARRAPSAAELEAARDAKYREIRDAELDHRTGKLSDADWRAQDRALRAEAVEILRRLDELGWLKRHDLRSCSARRPGSAAATCR